MARLMLRRLNRLHGMSLRMFSSNPPLRPPWLFIGLGNPGHKFGGTRHNVGFEMIDALGQKLGISVSNVHCKALFGEGFVGDAPVFLAKPQTYMNLSGESAGPLAAYYKLPLNRVMVFHDDMTLPCGVLRLDHKGGLMGIGRPPGQMDPKAFLLQKFNNLARERIDSALKEGTEVLKLIPSEGLAECARWFNKEQKYKHIRPPEIQLQTGP